jgi:hypothetical protein
MPLAGRNADVRITALTPTTSTGEAASLSSDGLYVSLDASTRRHWDPDSTPTLYLNSTAVSSTAYAVNHVQGRFQFSSTQSTGTYTADVEYLATSQVAGGREWALNIEADMFEVSTFGSSGWKEFQPNLNGATISIGKYWTDGTFMDYMTADNPRFVVEMVPLNASSTSARYEGFARVASDQPAASVDAIVGETINLVVDGQLFYTENP